MGKIEKKKITTALFIIPPIILIIALSPSSILGLMVLIATFLGLREFYRLCLPQSKPIERMAGLSLGLILSVLAFLGKTAMTLPFFVLTFLLLAVLFMLTSGSLISSVSNLALTFFGIFYIAFLLSHVTLIRNRADGKVWVLFLILTVWGGDVFALFSGTFFGRHKLYPKISPNKTIEGLIGAILGSILISLLFTHFFLPSLNRGICIILSAGVGFLGQLGDFTESMLKRSARVKDSGSLFPGHGGMLDRLDSFLFSAPFLHYTLPLLLKETL
ncbi:MAG: phosphatidate cytidylyltransferase [Thermodesulfobacteriota bacterium]